MLLRTDVPMPELDGLRNLVYESGVGVTANFDQIELRREDVIMGVVVVSATMAVMPYFGGTPQFTKSITTTPSADGEITEDGSTAGVAACAFILSAAEMTSTVPRAFLLAVTDSLGRETKYDSGYLVPNAVTPETSVDHIVISPTELLDIPLGTAVQMGAAAYDASDALLPGRVLTFSSSDSAVATVNAVGTVTTVGLGSVVITAASGGKQAHAQLSVSVEVVLLATFTDADGTDLDGWACDTGQVAIVQAEAWEIQGSQAKLTTASPRGFVVWGTGEADCIVSVELPVVHPTSEGGLWVRSVDDDNGFMVLASGVEYKLLRRELGSNTSLGTSGPAFDDDVPSVAMVGSGFSIRANGVEIITATDAFNVTATEHGLTAGDVTHRFKHLTVSR